MSKIKVAGATAAAPDTARAGALRRTFTTIDAAKAAASRDGVKRRTEPGDEPAPPPTEKPKE